MPNTYRMPFNDETIAQLHSAIPSVPRPVSPVAVSILWNFADQRAHLDTDGLNPDRTEHELRTLMEHTDALLVGLEQLTYHCHELRERIRNQNMRITNLCLRINQLLLDLEAIENQPRDVA